ncbi:MAG: hypothetical protein KYX68_03205 [Flavobacterium sp.]|nr:hypothetical protein [Flavobacterium sp.]
MKKILLLLTNLILLINFSSCSNDENSSNLTTEEQAIIGVWKHTAYGHVNSNGSETITDINSQCLNTHTFTEDKNINYKSYASCTDVEIEDGTWALANGLLTRTFPQNVTVVQNHNITFINPDKIKLFQVGNTTDFLIYKREGSTLTDSEYNIEVTGNYQTDWCNVTNNTAKVTFEFIQDNNVVATQNEQSNVEQSLSVNRNLTGNVIGVKLKLTDYNPNNLNSALGDGFESLHVKVQGNQTQDIYVDANPNHWLVSCTDICYEIDILFNTSSKQISVNSLWH